MDDGVAVPGAGPLQLGRFVVAAEWVGLLRSSGPVGDEIRFAPGGLSHAFDRLTGDIVCRADAAELEVFWVDFLQGNWAFRCSSCAQRAAELHNHDDHSRHAAPAAHRRL
jgi:hypothetical protein